MAKFNQNDLVIITNTGATYSGAYNYFEQNGLDINVASRFCYYESPKYNGIYRVLHVGSLEKVKKKIYCIESIDIHRMIYLISENGILKVGTADKDFFDRNLLQPIGFCCCNQE